MQSFLISEYLKFRSLGYKACLALSCSKTLYKFRELESQGVVRIRLEYDESFRIDWTEDEKEIKVIDKFIERYGVHGVITEFLSGDEWESADSIWGCMYKDCLDPFENDYLTQLMESAIQEYDKVNDLVFISAGTL